MNKRKRTSSGAVKSRQKGHNICKVYMLGFSDPEIIEIKKKVERDDVEYSERLTPEVSHIVINDKKSTSSEVSITKLYYAAISGSWIIRPEWLLGAGPEKDYVLATNSLEYKFTNSKSVCVPQEILKLCEYYATTKKKLFEDDIFNKVLFLPSLHENDELKWDTRSILEVSGATFVPSTFLNKLIVRGKNENYISIAVVFTNNVEDLDKSLLKILLEDGVPIIFYEIFIDYIKKKKEPLASELLEISENMWSSHILPTAEDNNTPSMNMSIRMPRNNTDTPSRIRRSSSQAFFLPQNIETWINCKTVFSSWMDYMNITPTFELLTAFLKENDNKTYYQSTESLNNFAQLISEFQLNTKAEEVTGLICYSAVSYLINSENTLFLPTPAALSFLFHNVVTTNNIELLDTRSNAFTYIKSVIQKYPPHNYESRLYWMQVLSYTWKNKDDDIQAVEYDVKKVLQGIRKLIAEAFKKDPIDENAVDILLQILETDLYFFEKGQEVHAPLQRSTGSKMKNSELLLTNPLAYLVVDDVGYTYGRGLDKGSKEFLLNLSKDVASHEYVARHIGSVTRLHMVFLEAVYFLRKQGENEENIRVDLSSVIRRMLQHQVARAAVEDFYPIQWIHSILSVIR